MVEAQALITGPFAESCLPEIKANKIYTLEISVAESEVAKLWDGRRRLVHSGLVVLLITVCLGKGCFFYSMKNLCAVHSESCLCSHQ